MWKFTASAVAGLSLGVGLAGCGESGSSGAAARLGDAVTVRDSAGVTIVENHDSLWTAETRWSIAPEPDLVIGSVDGSVPGTDWGASVEPLMTGDRVLVREPFMNGLRLFDPEGQFLRVLAPQGEGPTETTLIAGVGLLPGDTVAVFDNLGGPRIIRLDLNTGEGTSARTEEPPSDFGAWSFGFSRWAVQGWLDDGSYILANLPNMVDLAPGVQTMEQEWHRMSATGDHLGLIARLPQQRLWSGGEYPSPLPFDAFAMHAARGMSVWHAYPEADFSYSRYDTDRGLAQIVRADHPMEPVTPALMDRHWNTQDSLLAAQSGGLISGRMLDELRDAQTQFRAEVPAPEFVSPFVRILASPDGHIWLELSDLQLRDAAAPPGIRGIPAEASLDWAAFDPDGRWLGTVTTPAGLYVTDISNDHVIGFRKDDLDVAFVERYRILKPD